MPPPATLSERLACIVHGLCRACAARMVRNPAALPLLLLAWGRLHRMAARFAALAERARSGTLGQRRSPRQSSTRPQTPTRRLPRGKHWLIRLVPEATCFGSQLQHLLTDPDMAAFLEAEPQAGRILRPLCRMLAVPRGPASLPSAPATPLPPRAQAPASRARRRRRARRWSPPGSLSRRLLAAVGRSPPAARRRLA